MPPLPTMSGRASGYRFVKAARPGAPRSRPLFTSTPAEGRRALRVAPVEAAVEEEAARETLGHPPRKQQCGRAEKQHGDVTAFDPVRVPLGFDDVAPALDLLDLIEDEECRLVARVPGRVSQARPLRPDPLGGRGQNAVGRAVVCRAVPASKHLAGDGRLPHLPGTDDHLDQPWRFHQAREDDVDERAMNEGTHGGGSAWCGQGQRFAQSLSNRARPLIDLRPTRSTDHHLVVIIDDRS